MGIDGVPNATTGLYPYMSVYARTPRGPLAVLKKSWAGERVTPPNLGVIVVSYLDDLRSKLSEASQIAEQHTQRAQSGYALHYNLKAKHEQFEVGEQVIVLAPE